MKRKEFYLSIKRNIQQELFGELDFSKELEEKELLELIDEKIHRTALEKGLWLEERKQMRKEIFRAMRQLDILQELIENPDITEIMVNGKDDIFIEKGGELIRWENGFDSEEKLNDIIQQMVSGCNRAVNEAFPIVDARLGNGSRVNVVLKPIALNGPIVTIRRFPEKPMDMEKLIEIGALQEVHSLFLKRLVSAGYNILISGGTGSGKTTFLNALSNYIPAKERVITIEDSAELQITSIENLVRLETRNANEEGCRPITIRDLIRTALRMRPDRIIVGEVRGAEAVDLLQAMNTGHDGSLSTGHSNSAEDMLSRLETMVLMGMDLPVAAIRQQIASAVDIIIHLGRLRDKSRKVLEITEVCEYADQKVRLQPLFVYRYDSKKLEKEGELENVQKLLAAGLDLYTESKERV
ncbi:MAG: CpaF family protein [Lachnospiraceae bacterium]|nr:CpaF family protein [Lachnospiraceae bacterium]